MNIMNYMIKKDNKVHNRGWYVFDCTNENYVYKDGTMHMIVEGDPENVFHQSKEDAEIFVYVMSIASKGGDAIEKSKTAISKLKMAGEQSIEKTNIRLMKIDGGTAGYVDDAKVITIFDVEQEGHPIAINRSGHSSIIYLNAHWGQWFDQLGNPFSGGYLHYKPEHEL